MTATETYWNFFYAYYNNAPKFYKFKLKLALPEVTGTDCLWQRGVEIEDPILIIIRAIVHALRKSQSDSESVEGGCWNFGCKCNTSSKFCVRCGHLNNSMRKRKVKIRILNLLNKYLPPGSAISGCITFFNQPENIGGKAAIQLVWYDCDERLGFIRDHVIPGSVLPYCTDLGPTNH